MKPLHLGIAAALGLGVILVVVALQMQTPATAPRVGVEPQLAPTPLPTGQLLAIGTREAQDDLYCMGVIDAAHGGPEHASEPGAARWRNMMRAFALAGADKLIAARAATAETTFEIADAHHDQAARDLAEGTLRISLSTCERRGMALLPD